MPVLRSVRMSDSVETLDYEVFSRCFLLTSVSIGNNVTYINGMAFSRCHALESIVIPDSVVNIGYSAFFLCKSLKSVHIGKNAYLYLFHFGIDVQREEGRTLLCILLYIVLFLVITSKRWQA